MAKTNESWNLAAILAALKKLGKPQTAAIYQRHGAGENVFGVLTSEILKFKKKIKVDHSLAMQLWDTGNAESRILALLIADPEKVSRAEADRFLAEGQVRFLSCYLCDLLARGSRADATMRAWMKSKAEARREIGYGILAARLKDEADSITEAEASKFLATIEKEIHRSPNLARHTMNIALIAIGIYKPTLRKPAIAAAQRIGKVEVDHGETSCKTSDAVAYIEKAAKRQLGP
jgi:3-methyladenine DNA glycosylase AlkD